MLRKYNKTKGKLRFSGNIHESIARFEYKAWVIKRIPKIKCACVDHVTKQADSSCKRCLGLGTKIKIYSVDTTSREIKDTEALNPYRTDLSSAKIFYFKYGLPIEKDDVIVDSEFAFNVLTHQLLRGEAGNPTSIKCVCPQLKFETKEFLSNFKEIIENHNRPSNNKNNKIGGI